jgi:DNA-binding transcriptional LysR family regulator
VTEDFEAFATFARFLNFTRAASELNLSQPALHLKVRNLERSLGRKLYVRRGRGLALTPWGERVARYALDVHGQHAQLLRDLAGETPNTPIRLASHDAGFVHVLPGGIHAFWQTSNRPLSLLDLPAETLVSALRDKEADLVVTGVHSAERGLARVVIARYPQVAILRDDHRLASRTTIRLTDLAGEHLIVTPRGSGYREMISRNLAEAGVRWDVALETNHAHFMHIFTKLGVGIAIRSVVSRLEEGLAAVPIVDLPELEWSALYLPENSSDESLMDLVRLICEHAPPTRLRS